jgi:hypothetical protein
MNNNIFTFTTPFVSPRRPIPSSLGGYRDSRDATIANKLGLFHTSENGIRRLRGRCRRLVPVYAVRRFLGALRYDGERAMSARTRLDSTRETRRAWDEQKCLESVRTRVVLVDFGLEHEVVK